MAEVSQAAVQQEVRKDVGENGVERAGRIINLIERVEVTDSSDLLPKASASYGWLFPTGGDRRCQRSSWYLTTSV